MFLSAGCNEVLFSSASRYALETYCHDQCNDSFLENGEWRVPIRCNNILLLARFVNSLFEEISRGMEMETFFFYYYRIKFKRGKDSV